MKQLGVMEHHVVSIGSSIAGWGLNKAGRADRGVYEAIL